MIDEHAQLFQPGVQRLEELLRDNALEIALAEAARSEAQGMLENIRSAKLPGNFSATIIAMQMADSKDAAVRRLEGERVVLEDMAAPSKTFLTNIVNPAKAESSPYFPKLKLFLAIGVFLGGMAGIAFVFFREWQSTAARRMPGPAA